MLLRPQNLTLRLQYSKIDFMVPILLFQKKQEALRQTDHGEFKNHAAETSEPTFKTPGFKNLFKVPI